MATVRIALLVSVLVISGCRTYGGFDSEEALYAQIEKTNQQFADELSRVRAELGVIQNAAQTNRTLAPFVDQYESILTQHQEMILSHQALFESLEVKTGVLGRLSQSYRTLNRGLGAILAEQDEIRGAYFQLLNAVNKQSKGDAYVPVSIPDVSRYQAVPPYYESIRFALEELSAEHAVMAPVEG